MKSFFIVCVCFLACLELGPCADSGAASAPLDIWTGRGNKPVPPGAKLTIAFDRNEYVLGENVLLQFILENTGQEPFTADFGGDYDGVDRSLRFKVTARDEQGHVAPEPDPNLPCFGGEGFGKKLMPGEKLVISLPLMRYC